jgi:hypothetical protein
MECAGEMKPDLRFARMLSRQTTEARVCFTESAIAK